MKTRLVIELTKETFKLTRFSLGVKPMLENIVIESIDGLSEAALLTRVQGIVKANPWCLKPAEIIGIIPRFLAIIRYLRLPSHDPKEIASMVNLQAFNHIPYNREEVELDFEIIERLADGYALVMGAIVPRDAVLRFWDLLVKVGLKPKILTISSKGLFYISQRLAVVSLGTTMVIDVGHEKSEVIVCSSKGILSSRAINLGKKHLSPEGVQAWVSQVTLTMEAFKSEHPGVEIQRVVVYSQPDIFEDLKQPLTQQLSVNIERKDSFDKALVAKQFQWPRLMREEGVSVSVLLGVGYNQEPTEINLIPRDIIEKNIHSVRKKQLVMFFLSMIFALGVGIAAFSAPYIKQNQYVKSLELELKGLKDKAAKVQVKADTVKKVEATLAKRIIFVDVIRELYAFIPPQILLTNVMLMDKTQLSIQGYAKEASLINLLQKKMVDSARYEQVTLDYVNKRVTSDGEINYYKITARIKRKD